MLWGHEFYLLARKSELTCVSREFSHVPCLRLLDPAAALSCACARVIVVRAQPRTFVEALVSICDPMLRCLVVASAALKVKVVCNVLPPNHSCDFEDIGNRVDLLVVLRHVLSGVEGFCFFLHDPLEFECGKLLIINAL